MNTFKKLWVRVKQIIPKSVSFFKYLSVVAALSVAVHFVNNYISGQFKAGQAATEAHYAQLQEEMQKQQTEMKRFIDEAIAADTAKTLARIDNLEARRKDTTTIIQREIAADPRLSDPNLGLSDGLFEAVNKARMESHKND